MVDEVSINTLLQAVIWTKSTLTLIPLKFEGFFERLENASIEFARDTAGDLVSLMEFAVSEVIEQSMPESLEEYKKSLMITGVRLFELFQA